MTARLLIVQLAGDFREAWRLREETGTETYYGHGYILDQLAGFAGEFGEAAFLCALPGPYAETLPSGATVMGAGGNPYRDARPVIAAIERFGPTHLIVHGPMTPLLRWGMRRKIAVGCVMADSFSANPLRRWWRFGRLAHWLNDPAVSLVANHGVNAAQGLVRIGVRADKIVPWDFPHVRTPEQSPARSARGGRACDLFYVGSVEVKKGLGDLIDAVARLQERFDVTLRIAGTGDLDHFKAQAAALGVAERVEFLGTVPNGRIPELMRSADLVVVPSRHAFPEGLPLTLYEALASRTPTVASDHPMFMGHLVDGESAAIFSAGDSSALAARIADVLSEPALYARLSQGAQIAWHRMQLPVKWGEMIGRWVRGAPDDRAWLAAHTLAARGAKP
jgi:glycosyltransferase involved in cell wall biosynthesis